MANQRLEVLYHTGHAKYQYILHGHENGEWRYVCDLIDPFDLRDGRVTEEEVVSRLSRKLAA